jgi:hypothetical protein
MRSGRSCRGRRTPRGDRCGAPRRGPGASPTIDQRLRFLAARAELSALEGRTPDARRDLERAVADATASGRAARGLALRLQLAELDPTTSRAAAQAVEREARGLGLLALGERGSRSGIRGPAGQGGPRAAVIY